MARDEDPREGGPTLSVGDDGGAGWEPPVEDGRYAWVRHVGEGGMGRVDVVSDAVLERSVARKVCRPGAASGKLRKRLVREAQALARLAHPNIPPVYELGVEDGQPYYTMRLVEGDTLADRVAACRSLDERLGLLGALLAAMQAVAYAHRRGVVHRDLSGTNVLVGDLGETFVIDWGLARIEPLEGDEGEAGPVTAAGRGVVDPGPAGEREVSTLAEAVGAAGAEGPTVTVGPMGTRRYMAPEVVLGGVATAASDQWALGALLFLVLGGQAPPPDSWVGSGAGPTREDVAGRLRGVPGPLVSIAAKALAARPEHRYPSVEALAADLERWRDGREVQAHEYGARDQLVRVARARPREVAIGVGAGLLLVVLGVVGVAAWQAKARDAEQAAGEAESAAREAVLLAAAKDGVAAQAALGEGRLWDAYHLSEKALRVLDDPEIRGVRVAAGGAWLPTLEQGPSFPECRVGALSPTADRIACGFGDQLTVRAYPGGEVLWGREQPDAGYAPAVWSDDGELVAIVDDDGAALVLDGRDGSEVRRIALTSPVRRYGCQFVPGSHDLVVVSGVGVSVQPEAGPPWIVGGAEGWLSVGRARDGVVYAMTGDGGEVLVAPVAPRGPTRRFRAQGGEQYAFSSALDEAVGTGSFASIVSRVHGIDVRTGATRWSPLSRVGGALAVVGDRSLGTWIVGVAGRVVGLNAYTLTPWGDAQLPDTSRRSAVALRDGGVELHAAGADPDGTLASTWLLRPPAEAPPRTIPVDGVAPRDVAPGTVAGQLWVSDDAGDVRLLDWRTGRVVQEWNAGSRLHSGLTVLDATSAWVHTREGLVLRCTVGRAACEVGGGGRAVGVRTSLPATDGGLVGVYDNDTLRGVDAAGVIRWSDPFETSIALFGWAADGRSAVAVDLRGTWRMVDPVSGAVVAKGTIPVSLWGYGAPIPGTNIYYCGTGAPGDGGLVRLDLDAPDAPPVSRTLPARVTFAAPSSDGKIVAASLLDGTVRLFDGADLHELAVLRGHESEVWGVRFLRDDVLASIGAEGVIRLWSLRDLWTSPAAP